MRAIVHPPKAIVSAVMTLFFGGYGLYFAIQGYAPPAAVFLAFGALFGWLLFRYASVLSLDGEGAKLSFLGWTRRKLAWDQIREVGLIGENVFNHGRKKKTGDKYIYLSPVKLSADERFRMIVRWPPREQLYVAYTDKLLAQVMTFWQGEFETYNVEDLYPNSAEPRGKRE